MKWNNLLPLISVVILPSLTLGDNKYTIQMNDVMELQWPITETFIWRKNIEPMQLINMTKKGETEATLQKCS